MSLLSSLLLQIAIDLIREFVRPLDPMNTDRKKETQ
jgi:hypothetical protein